ncbi:hypothetical protein P153DRAFT_365400, partial [Dothidotthia symphoricarpi CBS 119687]
MSKWRQRGFVQDSDEEEDESQIESQGEKRESSVDGRVEGVDDDGSHGEKVTDGLQQSVKEDGAEEQTAKEIQQTNTEKEVNTTPKRSVSPNRPALSPFTPVFAPSSHREPTESPDPLQSTPVPRTQKNGPPPISLRPASSVAPRDSPALETHRSDGFALSSQILGEPMLFSRQSTQSVGNVSSQILGEPITLPRLSTLNNDSKITSSSQISAEDRVAFLFDDSDNDPLSEPPSIVNSPDTLSDNATPHRRTAVRVVIPSSNILQRQLAEHAPSREFRQRKPIQLHPYAIEGERYKQDFQSRGIKPVPRARSPQRQLGHVDTETQEGNYNPGKSRSNSLELEIPVSTPLIPRARKDPLQGSSTRRIASDPARHRLSDPQLRAPPAAKKRKLNPSLTQIVTSTSIFDVDNRRRDVWSIPPNSPPYSSSPPRNGNRAVRRAGRLAANTPVPSLPTPSNSSVFHDDPQPPPESDSEPVPGSIHKSGGGLRRPTRVVASATSSSATDESSESEQSDAELRNVGRKIKGVLPASWLRFDLQAQERRKAQAARERERARQDAARSPEPAEPQRGVAQKVKRRHRRASSPQASSRDAIVISDESDNEPEVSNSRYTIHVDDTVQQNASALAAMFDDRYGDDDMAHMEHDRLPLPTLGGTGPKRKRQTKLADAFSRTKRTKLLTGTAIPTGRRHDSKTKKRKHVNSRAPRPKPPPALSVFDVDVSSPGQNQDIPLFIKLARRQARKQPNLARQSPRHKQIRLHNVRDTEDANLTLQQWRQGKLKPRANASPQQCSNRQPLSDRTDVQQGSQQQMIAEHRSTQMPEKSSEPKSNSGVRQIVRRKDFPFSLEKFQRTSSQRPKSSQQKRKKAHPQWQPQQLTLRGPLPFRTAQLEGGENDFDQSHRKVAFEKELLRVDQQFGLQQPMNQPFSNPQLARFLADDDAILPPLPSARDIGELQGETSVPQPPPKRRLMRKKQAHRIDVDAREYRQPSEPAVQDVVNVFKAVQVQETLPEQPRLPVLQGLGPFGAQYPTTFDVSPLKDGTYFHSSTFIGSDQLRYALLTGREDGRDLDEPAGYCTISYNTTSFRCGPWNDETCSRLHDLMKAIWLPLDSQSQFSDHSPVVYSEALAHTANFLRSLIFYLSTHLRFLDPIDRKGFATKMSQFVQLMLDRTSGAYATIRGQSEHSSGAQSSIRVMTYLLVLSTQVYQIDQHPMAGLHSQPQIISSVKSISKTVIAYLVHEGFSELADFLKDNAKHVTRENGIQESDALVESVVVCMHALHNIDLPASGFWDIVSQELSVSATKAVHIQMFESSWATIFTLLPFIEFDVSGIPTRSRRDLFKYDNWTCIRDILKRLFELYPNTNSPSLNGYVRANLTRCHRLIEHWHWRRPEQMLNAALDFFGKNGLRPLRHEASHGASNYLHNLATQSSLALEPNENSFHVYLKCLAMGLDGMKETYLEKKIRSFVFRTIPNHGRRHPKDQSLDEDSLVALRNHHDLLCTLYMRAPPSCRPKLDHIRDLVNHEVSHREACRLNVRAWANLATFQLSADEPYTSTKPFALWHKEIMHQTLKQYRLAKTEAEDYLKSGVLDGTSDVSAIMVRQTMEGNQEQVIATLRDCIAGMRKAIQHTHDQTSLRNFLIDSDIAYLLELPHLEDRRLISVIRDTLLVLREYANSHKAYAQRGESQSTSEESQNYGGDSIDWDDVQHIDPQSTENVPRQSSLDFIEGPLWRLTSNAYGAESSPEDNLLMDCVDTWVLVAACQVSLGDKSWAYYIDPFSPVAWQQLIQTEQTRKFGPYYMAALIDCGPAVYEGHRLEFLTALLLSLAERESMLRFQNRLLHSIVQTDHDHPLWKNLPFFRNEQTGEWDITAETLHARRLSLISSILANLRDDVQATFHDQPARARELKGAYAQILGNFMNTMKHNYLQLQQGSTVTGSYVEFVQKVVQFLKQYTNDITPVLPFFTDSVAFPLPSTDPTYVVGRLCGYAPKASDSGTAKQLSMFIQTVAQQAAADNQQSYLVTQLTTALCTDEAPLADRVALRSVLLRSIFPAYLEGAFSSSTAFLIARPMLYVLPQVLDTMIFDLRVTQPDSLDAIVTGVMAVAHAFIRGTELLKDNTDMFQRPHILAALTHMLRAMRSAVPLLDYIYSRATCGDARKPPLVVYMEKFSVYIAQTICGVEPHAIPSFDGDAHVLSSELLRFCRSGLEEGMKLNWSERSGAIWFAHGNAKREVVVDIGTVEEEKEGLVAGIEEFHATLSAVYVEDGELWGGGRALDDMVM